MGKVIYPFLIMPDVTDSDTQSIRDQEEFNKIRLYRTEDYDFFPFP